MCCLLRLACPMMLSIFLVSSVMYSVQDKLNSKPLKETQGSGSHDPLIYHTLTFWRSPPSEKLPCDGVWLAATKQLLHSRIWVEVACLLVKASIWDQTQTTGVCAIYIGALHYSSAQSFQACRERRKGTQNLFLEPSKGRSVKWTGMEVYTPTGAQAHFQLLAFD